MAYPVVSAPYGFIPINLIGGQVYAGSTRQLPIASNYATAIFFGDMVGFNGGNVQKDSGTATAAPCGVFMGCSYTDPVFGKTFRQSYSANTVAADIMAYVADDPDLLFKTAVLSSGTTVGTVTRAAVGKNIAVVQNAGNAATGNSANGVGNSPATTATLPVRIVDVVLETQPTLGNFSEVICKWNAGMHAYNNATGV
jgi:hypothetical protein